MVLGYYCKAFFYNSLGIFIILNIIIILNEFLLKAQIINEKAPGK